MKPRVEIFLFLMAGVCLWLAAGAWAQSQPQSLPVTAIGSATNFTSSTYFEPPNEQHVEFKVTGAEATPLPGMQFEFKKMKIQKFTLDGKLEVTVQAVQVVYAPADGLASSTGHMNLETGDGNFHIEGDGFLWRQSDRSLNISNRVHTVIKLGITNLMTL